MAEPTWAGRYRLWVVDSTGKKTTLFSYKSQTDYKQIRALKNQVLNWKTNPVKRAKFYDKLIVDENGQPGEVASYEDGVFHGI
jgi:hypothetical protein